jgi:biopolymer transport protein ExbB
LAPTPFLSIPAVVGLALLLGGWTSLRAQGAPVAQTAPAAAGTNAVAAATDDRIQPFVQRLEGASRALSELRTTIVAEKLPLARALDAAEADLGEARQENETARRQLDRLALDIGTLGKDVLTREQERTYLGTLLGEYIRNLEARLHIVEVERHRPVIESARLALENDTLPAEEVFAAQIAALHASLARLDELVGGARFEGRAAGPDGLVKPGQYVFLGPIAFFASADGLMAGIAEQIHGSLEPSVQGFNEPAMTEHVRALVAEGCGTAPIDGSLGNARKIEETHESLREHIAKGGAVMVPILGLAGVVAFVVSLKWLQLSLIFLPTPRRLRPLLEAIRAGQTAEAQALAAKLRGPAGFMLKAGLAHLGATKDLIEEAMFEKILTIRFRFNRFIPMIAVGAACSPLLGLLGTVTGIINTFRMLTVFGSGDVKQLSGGISEALITTEFGLIVAIPALLCHAFLSRKSKGLLDKLEHMAISVMGEVEQARLKKEAA